MRKNIIFLMSFMFFIFPNLVSADCVDVRGFTSWYIEGGRTIIIYRDYTPLVFLDIKSCSLYPDSSIRIIRTYICDSDKIMIDGETCTIWAVRSARFSY